MLRMMQKRVGKSLLLSGLLGGLITGCSDGVELANSANGIDPLAIAPLNTVPVANAPVATDQTFIEPAEQPFLDPFTTREPLEINDTEVRSFIAADGTQNMVAASPACFTNQQLITSASMTFTDGFFLDTVESDIEGVESVSVIRARANVADRAAQFIEVCIQSDGAREYFIETRVQGPSVVEDSFFFTVNEGEPVIYDVGRFNQNSLGIAPDYVRSRDTDPLRVMLSDGRNTLRFFYRERNTALESVRAFRLPEPVPVINVDNANGELTNSEFNEAELQCAANTGLTPSEVTALVEQHLPAGPVEYFLRDTNFDDASLTYFWRTFGFMKQTGPTVFCLTEPRPVSTNEGFQEAKNVVLGPFEFPTLILGSGGKEQILSPHSLDDNVVFYGFGGDDIVQWQVGGQFFGGEGSDTVIGLTAGFFDGGTGDSDVVKAATAAANIENAEVAAPNLIAPAPPESFELIGEDDVFTFLELSEPTDERVTNYLFTRRAGDRDFSSVEENPVSIATPQRPRFESVENYRVKSILTVAPASEDNSEVSLLSSTASNVSYQLPTFDQLIERFGVETLRGPERVDSFEDATTANGTVRWLSAKAGTLRSTDPVFQLQLPDRSFIQSLDLQTLQAQTSSSIEQLCNLFVGDEIHIVVAQTAVGGKAFAFDAENLSLRWSRVLNFNTLPTSNFCTNFHLDQNDVFYALNENSNGALVDTIRISPDNVQSRLAPTESQAVFVRGFNNEAGAYDGTTAVLLADVTDDDNLPDRGLLVQRFDGSQVRSEFVALGTNLDVPLELVSDFNTSTNPLISSFDNIAVTDGVSIWSIGIGAQETQGIRRIDLTTGLIEAVNVLEPTDRIFDGRIFPMRVSNGVVELGREGRLIRFDANTLERLPDVKVVGNVVAFDDDSVTTHFIDRDDDSGRIRAFRFAR